MSHGFWESGRAQQGASSWGVCEGGCSQVATEAGTAGARALIAGRASLPQFTESQDLSVWSVNPHGLVWVSLQHGGFRAVRLFKWCREALNESLPLSKVEAALPLPPHLKSHLNCSPLATTVITASQVSSTRVQTPPLNGTSVGMGNIVSAIFRNTICHKKTYLSLHSVW